MMDAMSDTMPGDVYGSDSLDRFKSKRHKAAAATAPPPSEKGKACNAPTRLPRHQGLFAATLLNDLTDRSLDELYPARLRLLLLLTILTHRGAKSIHLPNATVKTIGLDRQQKHVCLKYLEARGFIRVEQEGQNSSIVTLLDWRTLRG